MAMLAMSQTSTHQPEAVLLLPAYNEAGRHAQSGFGLVPTIEKYQIALERDFGSSYQILVVDDGSRDNTAAVAKYSGAEVLRYATNRGRGYALKTGFLAVTSQLIDPSKSVVGYTDADGSYSPDTFLRLVEAITDGNADLAVAYRARGTGSHKGRLRQFTHVALHSVCEQLAPTGAIDPQAGCKTFRGDVAADLWKLAGTDGWAADREVLHRAKNMGLRLTQVEASITSVKDSRVRAFKDAINMCRDSRRIAHNTGQKQ